MSARYPDQIHAKDWEGASRGVGALASKSPFPPAPEDDASLPSGHVSEMVMKSIMDTISQLLELEMVLAHTQQRLFGPVPDGSSTNPKTLPEGTLPGLMEVASRLRQQVNRLQDQAAFLHEI